MTECSVDGEWRSDVDIKRCGAYRYFESEHCLPLILCWSIDRAPVQTWTILEGRACPPDLAAHIRSGGLIRAFNAAFERLGFRWLAAHWGWPEPRLEQYRCTAVEGAAMSLPRRLDKIGDALGISAKKDKRGDKLIKFFSIPKGWTNGQSQQTSGDSAPEKTPAVGAPLWNEPADHSAEFGEYVEYCRQDKVGNALGISAKKDKRDDKLIKFFSIPITRKEVMSDEAERAQLRPLDTRPPAWNEPGAFPVEFGEYVEYCRQDKIGDALGISAKKDKRGDKLIKFFSIPKGWTDAETIPLQQTNGLSRSSERTTWPSWNEPTAYPAEFEEYVEYCRQDVRAEQEVASRLIPLSDAEWRVYALNERVNDRGLRIDVRSARSAILLVEKAKEEINREIAEVTGGAVTAVTQVARLKAWCATQGLDLPSLDKETIDDVLQLEDSTPRHVYRALELRAEGAKPSTDKIGAMLDRSSRDGRARGVYLAHGAGQTGRFSSRGVQAHNMPKYRKCFEDAHLDSTTLFEAIRTSDPAVLERLYGPELGRPLHLISDAVRSFIWADPGKEFLVADYSSIEGVMSAWSTGEAWELEAYVRAFAGTGPGVYEISAADMFGIPVEAVTKVQRKGGKVRILSCQYATGPNGILKFARHEGIKMGPLFPALWAAADAKRRAAAERRLKSREKRGDPVLAAYGREAWLAAELTKVSYRAQHPRVEAAWGSLEDGAITAIRSPGSVMRPNGVAGVSFTVKQGFLWMRLPSGRCLAYGRPRLHAQVYARIPLKDGSWSDSERMDWVDAKGLESRGLCRIEGECKPKIIVSGTDSQTETWKRFPIYGGSLYNNYIQGMARDVLVHGMQKAEDAGLEINLHTHDELGAEVWRGSADPAWFERLICDLPPWCAGLPLTAKAFTSKRYRKD